MRKYVCFFAVVFFLCLSTQGITQELSATDPDILRHQVAKALRAGDIELAMKGFARSEKSETIIRALDAVRRNQLADLMENAQAIYTSENDRAYRYDWTDEAGNMRHTEFIMRRNELGQWQIISW